jgi:septum formation inhibitor-activating ATPase MinD
MGNVIAFVPASGGVGSSTLAAAVTVRAAAAGRSVVAVDLDRLAGRLDVVFGLEQEAGWRWAELADVAGVVDGRGLAGELPVACGVPLLSGLGGAGWGGSEASSTGAGSDGGAGDGSDVGSDDGSDVGSDDGSDGGSGDRRDDGRSGRPGERGDDVWLDTVPDVVAGLAEAHDLTVLDLPRDAAVLGSVAELVDAVVVVAGCRVPQLAAASVVVPGVRRLLSDRRDQRRAWGSEPLLPIEPWVVLRGNHVEPDLEDLLMDELDVPVVAVVGDDRRLVAEVSQGLPPGARGRGEVVRAADRLLLRLVTQQVAA